MTLMFTVPGRPVPKERPRVVRGRTYTPPRTAAYEALCGLHAMKATAEWRASTGAAWSRTARYDVTLVIHCHDARPRDLDNLAKSTLDGCIGSAGLWLDDSQIDRLLVERGEVDRLDPRTIVTVTRLPVDPVVRRGR
jgi:Holliday junction resolvase RusA-like endonuclease